MFVRIVDLLSYSLLIVGINFWTVGSRKVFAVKEDVEIRRSRCVDEEPSVSPISGRLSEDNDETLNKLVNEVKKMKEKIKGFKTVAFRHKFSIAFYKQSMKPFNV